MEQTILDTYFLQNSEQLRAIAESTRWRMLNLLIAKPLTGSQLARLLKTSRPRAHYHLKILEKAGLIRFVEERQRQHMIERYYRAIAVNYRTENVLSQAGQAAELNGHGGGAGAALSDIIQSMVSLVALDVSQPSVQPLLAKMNYNYQSDLRLFPEQLELMKQELRQVVAHFTELERQNQAIEADKNLMTFRYTLILTPTAALDLNGAEAGRKGE